MMFNKLKIHIAVSACLGLTLGVSQLALANTTGKIFVAGDGSDNVVVINAHDNSIITTIDTGAGTAPHNIVVSADNRFAWVALKSSGQVAKFDTQTNALVATYSTGGGFAPVHMAASADGNWLYVNNKNSDQIVKMSTADGSIAASYTFGGAPSLNYTPHDIDISSNGQVWVTDQANGVVSVLDANLNGVVNNIAVGNNPIQLAFSNDGTEAYVSNYDDNTVSVINVAAQSETLAFDMGGSGGTMGPMGALLSPDGSTLWLSGTVGNTVHGHSLTDGGVYAYTETDVTTPLVGAHGLDITDDGNYLYASIFYDGASVNRDAIAVIDAITGSEVTRFYTPGANGLHGLAYVAPVPVPAAVWLFGSGLLGLVGMARRKSV